MERVLFIEIIKLEVATEFMANYKLFITDTTDKKSKYFIYASYILYILDILLFFFIGIVESSNSNIVTGLFLIFWIIFTILLFNNFNFKTIKIVYYAILVGLLGTIEEVIVYYNGGGLNGTATSLLQDLFLTIPVFVLLGVALYLFKNKFQLNSSDFYIYGSIYGFILEIIIGGKLAYYYLFIGPALVIYGSMLAAFAPKEYDETKKGKINSYIKTIAIIVIMFIFMIAGAIIGDSMYTLIAKP